MRRKIETELIHTEEGFNNLRVAIVRQAARDYAFYGKRLKFMSFEHPKWCEYKHEFKDAEEFLLSDWAEWLVDLDLDYIVKKVRERIETEDKDEMEEV